MSRHMTFDAVDLDGAGRKWRARWDRSWPDYEAWFVSRGGDDGPSRADCEAELARAMPELVQTHAELTALAGGGDRAARFLSGWCPPPYLGGCTLAAHAGGGAVRLLRNYDLSPDLNEGLLLRSVFRRPVMGMTEFLWGLSDGINDAGLSVALAFGGRREVAPGFGVTHILRYVLETCSTVTGAMTVLRRIPSHMAYNLVLADAGGHLASVELRPGGGVLLRPDPLAANHQLGRDTTAPSSFARLDAARRLLAGQPTPDEMTRAFLSAPLRQTDFEGGFGTLFTAEYDPVGRGMTLHWPGESWTQRLADFREGRRVIDLDPGTARHGRSFPLPDANGAFDWVRWGLDLAARYAAHCPASAR